MDARVANTKAPLWERIANPRDARPELERLRSLLSKDKQVSEALEEFLYSHYHYLLGEQRFESDESVRNADIMTAKCNRNISQANI